MRFEVLNALRHLEERTPAYLREEIFAHGSLKTRADALAALADLDPEAPASHALRAMIQVTPDSEGETSEADASEHRSDS